jgi:hypothetical protein
MANFKAAHTQYPMIPYATTAEQLLDQRFLRWVRCLHKGELNDVEAGQACKLLQPKRLPGSILRSASVCVASLIVCLLACVPAALRR